LSTQVPAKVVTPVFDYNPYQVEATSSALFVIERGPIENVQQLVHTINPELHDYGFYIPSRTATLNAQKVDPMFFCSIDPSGGLDSVKCIVIALPPWHFAPQDFKDFTTMDSVGLLAAYRAARPNYYRSFLMAARAWMACRMTHHGRMLIACGRM
jgi:hypothetical protein